MTRKRTGGSAQAARTSSLRERVPGVATLGAQAAAEQVGGKVAGAAASVRAGAVGQGAGEPLLNLLAGSSSGGPFAMVLEVVGEGGLSLHSALALWQREQDAAQNRAWRRPGGLQRLAGL